MIPQEAITITQVTLETMARKIYRFESPQQVGVVYDTDGVVITPNLSFTEREAESILVMRLEYIAESE